MVKVITYGTFDLLHEGHIRLLQRARALGDMLVVGVTADGFDLSRGKINVQQTLVERIEGVRATGLADQIIVEEYEGQKIDDIQRLGIDIFTVGSDWEGQFDYLRPYCRVVYLPRTQGVSSSALRAQSREIALGLVGENAILNKFAAESAWVNGVRLSGICARDTSRLDRALQALPQQDYDTLLPGCDAVYIASHPSLHESHVRKALEAGRHVLCESPIALSARACDDLFDLARGRGLILADGNKTAYSTAYSRLLLLLKTGKIGRVVSVDATCTSLRPPGAAAGIAAAGHRLRGGPFRLPAGGGWLRPVYQNRSALSRRGGQRQGGQGRQVRGGTDRFRHGGLRLGARPLVENRLL